MDRQDATLWRASPRGSFNNARNVVVNNSTFIDGNHTNDKDSMDLLASYTIPGAEYDSFERYPPPSCHPGTRLDISGNIISWMRNPARTHKTIWLHGPAGVGKSAIIQTLAESESESQTSILGATLFFSRPAERNNPQQVFNTIAYQLAVKYKPYRRYVVELLAADSKVVKKSLVEQFKRFIMKPFAEQRLLEGETILITLDGLDECEGEFPQREIIFLIGRFSLQHPNTPLIWIIASRPEPHISSAFSRQDTQASFLEIDMPIDSDQACSDVERFLRDRFTEIRENYSLLFPPAQLWPAETQFVKVATHASGLFVLADTVVRFVEDVEYSNPVAQLQKVTNVLDTCMLEAQENPFAALDALYTQILSWIPSRVLPITRKLLTLLTCALNFAIICNILAIDQADAYSALRKLHSVVRVPPPERAGSRYLGVFHASFTDYLQSPVRSGPFWISPLETERLWADSCFRVLSEAHNLVESVVQVSNINISWYFGSVGATQKEVFYHVLVSVLRSPPEQQFGKLGNLFQDIDYANLGSLVPDSLEVISALGVFCQPRLMPRLKGLGIFTTIPLESLNLGLIGSNGVAYIASDKRNPLPGQDNLKWSQDIPGFWFEDFFESRSQLSAFDDWCFKAVALSDELVWAVHIRQHLASMSGLLPYHQAILLGKGQKTCAAIIASNLSFHTTCTVYVTQRKRRPSLRPGTMAVLTSPQSPQLIIHGPAGSVVIPLPNPNTRVLSLKYTSDTYLFKLTQSSEVPVVAYLGPGWTADIHPNLTSMMGHLPSHPVRLLGNGPMTCAVITLDILDRR